MSYIIKTFDKEYGDDLYVADIDTCNLTSKKEEAIQFDDIEEGAEVMSQMAETFTEYDFELEKYNKPQYVYMLVQHQAEAPEYNNKTFAIYSDKDAAYKKCKELNEEYAQDVVWVEGEEYINVDTYDEMYHYYTVEGIMVDDPRNKDL